MDKREDLFAATPPLEALKMLFSLAVTEGVGYERGQRYHGMKLDFIDVKRAYFHAKCTRDVYVLRAARAVHVRHTRRREELGRNMLEHYEDTGVSARKVQWQCFLPSRKTDSYRLPRR